MVEFYHNHMPVCIHTHALARALHLDGRVIFFIHAFAMQVNCSWPPRGGLRERNTFTNYSYEEVSPAYPTSDHTRMSVKVFLCKLGASYMFYFGPDHILCFVQVPSVCAE